jgi:hypothetical protein
LDQALLVHVLKERLDRLGNLDLVDAASRRLR